MRPKNDGDAKALIENESVYVINNPTVINKYAIYLLQEIGEPKNYRDVFNILREAHPDDYFIIYLNNYGGYVNTGLDIVNAMRACQGHVYTCITGPVYSMAPLIALAGEKIFVEQNTFMMFHDYSSGSIGKGNEMKAQIEHEKPHFDEMFRDLTRGFMTEEEIKSVLKGQDLYLNRKQMLKRLKKLGKLGNGGVV